MMLFGTLVSVMLVFMLWCCMYVGAQSDAHSDEDEGQSDH